MSASQPPDEVGDLVKGTAIETGDPKQKAEILSRTTTLMALHQTAVTPGPECLGSEGLYDGTRHQLAFHLWTAEMSRNALPLAKMLTVSELAALLQVPEDTIYYWRTRGEGPRGHKVGRYVRFHEDDVRAWLARQADES